MTIRGISATAVPGIATPDGQNSVYKIHPVNKISHANQQLDFLTVIFCEEILTNLDERQEFGLYLILRQIHDDISDSLDALTSAEIHLQ